MQIYASLNSKRFFLFKFNNINMHIELLKQLNTLVENPIEMDLGPTHTNHDIPSKLGPFMVRNQYCVEMPANVTKALLEITHEYNTAFSRVVEQNLEIPSAYQYALDKETGEYINLVFQIDMRALPQEFLISLNSYEIPVIKEVLKRSVFEFEDSLAMLNLLRMQFETNGVSQFRDGLDRTFDSLRTTHCKGIALLATTQEKLDSILACELGVEHISDVDDQTVKQLLGYDKLIGPEEYLGMLENNSAGDYLLYVRSSSPVANLRDPRIEVPPTILDEQSIRHEILSNCITLNLGALNDTKIALLSMGLGVEISSENLAQVLENREINELCAEYGLDIKDPRLRLKPRDGVFGCYGHHTMNVSDLEGGKRKKKIVKDLKQRGEYIVQAELPSTQFSSNGEILNAIHRNFVGYNMQSHQYETIEGVLAMMPVNPNARILTVHGSSSSSYSPVILCK